LLLDEHALRPCLAAAVGAAAGPSAVGRPIAAIRSRSLGAPAASIGLDPAAAAR
jgi:hypothetical protein